MIVSPGDSAPFLAHIISKFLSNVYQFFNVNTFKVFKENSTFGTGFMELIWRRWQLVDYTKYTYTMEYKWSCRKPREMDTFYNIIAPFTNFVWAILGVTVVAIGESKQFKPVSTTT